MSAGGRAGRIAVALLLATLFLSLPAHAEPSKPKARKQASRESGPCVYIVKNGDTIGHIAARYGTGRQSLAGANRLAKPQALRLGQRLSIPGCRGQSIRVTAVPPAPTLSPDGTFRAAVGPRRVSTQLYLGVPSLDTRPIDFAWPVTGSLASPFGRRRSGWHAGIDIKAEMGSPIMAAAAGTVITSGWERAYGRVVRVEHDNGFVTVYAHNLQNFVEAGDRVETGTVLATVGRSGRSTAYHLHFEIRRGDTVYDPIHLLPERDALVARADDTGDSHADDDEDE